MPAKPKGKPKRISVPKPPKPVKAKAPTKAEKHAISIDQLGEMLQQAIAVKPLKVSRPRAKKAPEPAPTPAPTPVPTRRMFSFIDA